MDTATAYQDWNNRWQSEEGRADWREPDPDVRALIGELRSRNVRRVLDLGCGVGRHALYLAAEGFEVTAIDASEAGIAYCRGAANEMRLHVDLHVGSMLDLPFPDASFDYLLTFNVIYHGAPDVVRRSIAEIARVIRPGGLLQATLLSKRNAGFGVGTEIAPDTFVVPDASDDKVHAHHYSNAADAVRLLGEFELISLIDREQKRAGHWHWHLLAERLA